MIKSFFMVAETTKKINTFPAWMICIKITIVLGITFLCVWYLYQKFLILSKIYKNIRENFLDFCLELLKYILRKKFSK
jgi:hypothetical protein